MRRLPLVIEIIIIALLFVLGSLFLFRLAYLPIWTSMSLGMLYVLAVTIFLRFQYGLHIPLLLPLLAVLSVSVDGIGNYFGFYRTQFRYVQYDEISHALIPFLTAPLIIWLLRAGLERFGYHLPLGLITLFAITIMFTISGFYEVLELWDDKYMHPEPGMRIHGPYDTPNDLQWDLFGIVAGAVVTWLVMKTRSRNKPDLPVT